MRECLAPGPGFLEIKISFGECLHNKSIKDKAELSKAGDMQRWLALTSTCTDKHYGQPNRDTRGKRGVTSCSVAPKMYTGDRWGPLEVGGHLLCGSALF